MNKVVLMGRLTKDAELRTTTSGTPIASFTLAVDRAGKNKDGERETDFIYVSAFGKTAEVVNQYFSKGERMLIEGELRSRQYEKDGERRTIHEVLCLRVEFVERR